MVMHEPVPASVAPDQVAHLYALLAVQAGAWVLGRERCHQNGGSS